MIISLIVTFHPCRGYIDASGARMPTNHTVAFPMMSGKKAVDNKMVRAANRLHNVQAATSAWFVEPPGALVFPFPRIPPNSTTDRTIKAWTDSL